ncbi:unnamed protein product, partial [Symbiodinium pilosum]
TMVRAWVSVLAWAIVSDRLQTVLANDCSDEFDAGYCFYDTPTGNDGPENCYQCQSSAIPATSSGGLSTGQLVCQGQPQSDTSGSGNTCFGPGDYTFNDPG